MGLGTKAYVIGAILTFYSSFAAALGLGEITLNSALNQPLDAKIQLLHVRDLTQGEILVGLASPAEFAQSGVDRSMLLNDLTFKVDLNAPGGAIIRVTSKNPVREPFVNFLVVAQWPSGKLLREYTLLVDLPVFSGAKAAPVQAAPRGQSAPTQRPAESSSPRVARPAPTTAANRGQSTGGEYGPIGANENLWSIALQLRPDSSVTVQQTMLALQKLNPDAFINNNINLLRRGQVLRVPDRNEIQALSAREAINEVAEQNRRWSQRGSAPEETSAQLEGSKSLKPTRTEPTAPEGRIKLSSADQPVAEEGTGAGEDEDGRRVVARELAATQEELDAASRENAELESRLGSVEEQIETMEKLLEVSSAEMRALELAAQQTNAAEDQPSAAEDQPSAGGDQPSVEAEQPSAETQEEPLDSSAEAPVQTQPQPVAPSEKTWLDLALDNILYIAIALGAIVVGIAVMFYLRGRDDGFDDDFEEDFHADFEHEYEPQLPAQPLEDDRDLDTVSFNSDSDRDGYAAAELSTEAETEDVVGECDIHIAYSQYEQAEEKLTRALEREPTNIAMRLKLLEVFAAQSDAASFDNHFAKIYVLGDREAIDRASMLREGIDEAAPFDLSAQDTSQFESRIAGGDDAADHKPVPFDNETPDENGLGLADDTLRFDYDKPDDSRTGADELELDLVGLDDDFDDERTIIQNRSAVTNTSDGSVDFDYQNDEGDELTYDETTSKLAQDDDSDVDLHNEIETSLNAIEDSFELDADASVREEGATTLDDLAGELGDLDFDLDEIDADLSFDDVELELEGQGTEGGYEIDDEVTRVPDVKPQTLDLSDEDAADLPFEMQDNEGDFEYDESLLDSDVQKRQNQLSDGQSVASPSEHALELESDDAILDDFDLDRDLESAISTNGVAEDTSASSELDDLDFGDLEGLNDLDIDSGQIDGGEAAEFEMADEEDGLPRANIAGEPLSGDASKDEPETIAQELANAELAAGDDFSEDFDLDDLDKELDSLTSDFDGDLASADALMDEPITEFDEFNFDDLDDDAKPAAVQAETAAAEPIADERAAKSADVTLVTAPSADHNEDFEIPDFDPENDDDSNLDFLSDNDETATKLDLARAYIDMGDVDGAKDILDEIAEEGNDQQKQEAETLLSRIA